MNLKYGPFEDFLSNCTNDNIRISFSDMEKIVGSKLPKTAYNHDVWWANTVYQPFMKMVLKSGWRQKNVERFIEFVEFEKVHDHQKNKKRLTQKIVNVN